MAADKEGKNLKSKLEGDSLDLSLSELTVVPAKEIAALKKVAALDLSANHITSLPDDFCLLKNLVKLDLSSNKLQSLPENFGKLENLQKLDLYKNSLKTLPVSFANLKQLRWLDVKDNPLEESLQKVAGDCLDGKQCGEAALKVVKHMQKISADREREKQNELKKQRQVEAEEKAKEDEAKNAKAAEKKKEKERKKQANNARDEPKQEEDSEESKESKKIGEKKRSPQKEKGSTKPEKLPKPKKGRGFFGCIRCLIAGVVCLVAVVSMVLLVSLMTIYWNCSQPSGKEFIPASRPLCHDLYQLMQTNRISNLTWDWKATVVGISSAVFHGIKEANYTAWMDTAVDTVLICRDNIAHFSMWAYENGSKMAVPFAKKMAEWFWVAFAVVFFLLDKAARYIFGFVQWAIEAAADVFNNFPAYWEKVKFYWNNLK